MRTVRLCRWTVLAFVCAAAPAQELVNAVFIEPVGKIDANNAEIQEKMPLYRRAADPAKYADWLHNEWAERAFRLYRDACEIERPGGGKPDYYVALVPGGNHAAVGFRLQDGGKVQEFPRQPYILLDAQPGRFMVTLLHETGHMAMETLAGGRRLEGRDVSGIPHTTAALSDRATAFSEGWAIHLETLAAHLGKSGQNLQRYHRGMALFGDAPWQANEYFRQSADLASYSQNVARYLEVRENNYAFASAFQGPDYLRVQLEKARDFATLRDADQLLQSEGFYASFFFLTAIRGTATPSESVIADRGRQWMRAMHAVFAETKDDGSAPWLPKLVAAYIKLFPDEKAAAVDALNDLSHGVFVDPSAAVMWREHYLAALRLDQKKMNIAGIDAARKRWREQVIADPQILLSRVGPEIGCTISGLKVRIEAFGEDSPVRFDLNTVEPGVMRLVPGISEAEVAAWQARRAEKPFTNWQDFRARSGLSSKSLAALAE